MPAPPKPLRGSGLLERRVKRQARVKAEQAVMHAALVRDKMTCRWPQCEYRVRKLPIDPAHLRHRGMGGNPSGDRTASTGQIVALCRVHHGLYDACEVEIDPLTDRGADGPLAFLAKHPETGQMVTHAIERVMGESVERSVK